MFAWGGMDPASCWVTEGQLWVSQTATGGANERDVAATWRTFYQVLFGIYLAFTIFPCLGGIFSCIGDKVAAVGACCFGVTGCAMLAKIVIWWWLLVLRASEEGSVAAGKMIMECEQANPNLTAVNSLMDTVADAIDELETTDSGAAADGGRLLQEGETALTALMGGASCNDPEAFQIKGGKLLLAWLIVAAVMCK